MSTRPEVTKWLSTLERGLPLSRLWLGPLSKQDTLHWLRAMNAGRSYEEDEQDHAATRRVEQLEHRLNGETSCSRAAIKPPESSNLLSG